LTSLRPAPINELWPQALRKSATSVIFWAQKIKRWILQALDGHSSRTIGWVVAGGDAARMKRLDRKREQ